MRHKKKGKQEEEVNRIHSETATAAQVREVKK